MVSVNPRVKASLEKLYDAAEARKGSLPTLEGRKMSEAEFEEKIDALTDDLLSWIGEAKRKAFDDGVAAGMLKSAVESSGETGVAGVTVSTKAVPPQTNVFVESQASEASALKKTGAAPEKSGELEAKLALLNDKLDEVDGAIASIHEMQFDLQKTQEEVKREFAAKLGEFAALNRETGEYIDSVRAVASRMTDVSAKLGDALEENSRANAAASAAREAPALSFDAVTEKLGEIERQIDSLGEKTASKEMQEENSRLLSSQGIELSSLKSALKKQLKSVRKASKRITRVSRELEEVEGAVKRSGRKTNRSVRRVAEEIGAEKKSAKRFAKKAKVNASQAAESAKAATAKVVKAVKTVKAAKAFKAAKTGSGKRAKKANGVKSARKAKGARKAKRAVKRVSKANKTVVTTRKKGEKVNVTINTA